MPRYLVDANLPYRFSIWHGELYTHQFDLGDNWKDREIWEYAKVNDMTIITKDADFYHKIILTKPPPRVIHIRLGNMTTKALYNTLLRIWPEVTAISKKAKLVIVYEERIEFVN